MIEIKIIESVPAVKPYGMLISISNPSLSYFGSLFVLKEHLMWRPQDITKKGIIVTYDEIFDSNIKRIPRQPPRVLITLRRQCQRLERWYITEFGSENTETSYLSESDSDSDSREGCFTHIWFVPENVREYSLCPIIDEQIKHFRRMCRKSSEEDSYNETGGSSSSMPGPSHQS